MSYKEQIFKELEKIIVDGGAFEFKEHKPYLVKQYVFQFNQINGSDLMCRVSDVVATVSRRKDNPIPVEKVAEDALLKLKSVGDQCVLDGNINTLRSYVSRFGKQLGLKLTTRIIDGKLHVVVMGVKE